MINELFRLTRALTLVFCLTLLLAVTTLLLRHYPSLLEPSSGAVESAPEVARIWQAPDTAWIAKESNASLIRYGKDLIARTSHYLGPQGVVSNLSNGMNCQNCHLQAGTKPFGNNYGSVASTYPKFRARSGTVESIEKRVNDCLERSLNGKSLDSLSREMRAMVAYIEWLGRGVPKGQNVAGSGLVELDWLSRAADPALGKSLYLKNCQTCHGYDGEGQRISAKSNFINPPLWGEDSFTTGAGLLRISNFARYIKANMPNGATYEKPILTDEEAWDIAAYVVSMARPEKRFKQDWPKIDSKPVDHPFGPYADSFSEQQHKYGPFKDILAETKK